MNRTDLILATRFNKSAIQQSTECGCISCLTIFPARCVVEFTDDQTAVCPNSFMMTVVGNYDLGEIEYYLLAKLV